MYKFYSQGIGNDGQSYYLDRRVKEVNSKKIHLERILNEVQKNSPRESKCKGPVVGTNLEDLRNRF